MGKAAVWALWAAASREWVRPPLGSTGGFPCVPEGGGETIQHRTNPIGNKSRSTIGRWKVRTDECIGYCHAVLRSCVQYKLWTPTLLSGSLAYRG